MNIEVLRRVQQDLRTHPENFCQGSWHACIAARALKVQNIGNPSPLSTYQVARYVLQLTKEQANELLCDEHFYFNSPADTTEFSEADFSLDCDAAYAITVIDRFIAKHEAAS